MRQPKNVGRAGDEIIQLRSHKGQDSCNVKVVVPYTEFLIPTHTSLGPASLNICRAITGTMYALLYGNFGILGQRSDES